jgi:hypothetical protein
VERACGDRAGRGAGERAVAVTTPDFGDGPSPSPSPSLDRGQKAACAEKPARAGSTYAGGTSWSSRGFERLILPKAVVDR